MQSDKVRSEFVIHWGEIFLNILKRWWLILIALIVGGGVGVFYGQYSYHPMYETQAVFLVSYSGRTSDSMTDINSEYVLVQRILNNCVKIAEQNKFMYALEAQVNEDGKIPHGSSLFLSAEYLGHVISYKTENTNNTSLIVSVKTDDADKSLRITNALTEIFADYITSTYHLADGESLVFSSINLPTAATAPTEGSKTLLFGALMGVAFAVLCMAVLFFVALADNRIKTEANIEVKYDLPILGIIPRAEDIMNVKGEKVHESKKN